jgi:multidrug resistance efflux pump
MKQLMSRGGFMRVSLATILVLALVGGGVAFFWHHDSHKVSASTNEGEGEPVHVAIHVKTVKPHYDKTFSMIEKRPADVLAYYRDDLACRVPGVISMIRTDKGDTVKQGEPLIKVDVPELEASVKEQKAALDLARSQVKQKEAALTSAQAELGVVEAKINATGAKLRSDKAYLTFREKQAQRFQSLLASRSIEARLVDEQEDRREAAFEAVNAAVEAVNAAKAQKISAEDRIKQADADLEESRRKVEVVQAEVDHAQAMLDFATIKAPFDGVIVDRDRHANVGAVVQKADSGTLKPLLTIQRSDIVTVVMRVPDNFAPYITPETEAIF